MSLFRKKDNSEYEFLPSALEIIESPAAPKGSLVIWGVFGILVCVLLWSYFGKVDEVAVARGKVITNGRIKVVQPVEEGIVTGIYVTEGQRVKQGEVLVDLDNTLNTVEKDSLEKSLNTAKLENDLLMAELDGKSLDEIAAQRNLSKESIEMQKRFKEARDLDYLAKEEVLKSVLSQKQQEKKILDTGLSRIEQELTILHEDEQKLNEEYISAQTTKKEWEKKKNEMELKEKEKEMQKLKILQVLDQIDEASKNLESMDKEKKSKILNQVVENEKKVNEIEAQYTKTSKRIEFQKLTSPVDGTVHMMATNTIGGVVTPAQPLLSIVPEGTPLIIEANVLNKDIGFVKINQEVEIKLDTFPFQKYGVIKGVVMEVSPDSVDDEKLGSVYKMKVSLKTSKINVSGKFVDLSPGMTVSAEVKTGNRRIIEFFLEPITKYLEESLKLR